MKKFIERDPKGAFDFTNNAVDNIRQDEGFNTNHLAKSLSAQCDTYKDLVKYLLKSKGYHKKIVDEEVESKR